jgi:hypothetical protein
MPETQIQIKSESKEQTIKEFSETLDKLGFTYIFDKTTQSFRIFGEILESKFDLDNSLIYELSFQQDDTKFIDIWHYSEYTIIRLYSFEKGDPIKFKLNERIGIRYRRPDLYIFF